MFVFVTFCIMNMQVLKQTYEFYRFRVIQKALETVSKEEQRTIVQVTFGNVYIYEFINERVYLFIKKYEIHPFVKGLFCKYKPK